MSKYALLCFSILYYMIVTSPRLTLCCCCLVPRSAWLQQKNTDTALQHSARAKLGMLPRVPLQMHNRRARTESWGVIGFIPSQRPLPKKPT